MENTQKTKPKDRNHKFDGSPQTESEWRNRRLLVHLRGMLAKIFLPSLCVAMIAFVYAVLQVTRSRFEAPKFDNKINEKLISDCQKNLDKQSCINAYKINREGCTKDSEEGRIFQISHNVEKYKTCMKKKMATTPTNR